MSTAEASETGGYYGPPVPSGTLKDAWGVGSMHNAHNQGKKLAKRQSRGGDAKLRMTEDGVAKMHNAELGTTAHEAREVEGGVDVGNGGVEVDEDTAKKSSVSILAQYLDVWLLIGR